MCRGSRCWVSSRHCSRCFTSSARLRFCGSGSGTTDASTLPLVPLPNRRSHFQLAHAALSCCFAGAASGGRHPGGKRSEVPVPSGQSVCSIPPFLGDNRSEERRVGKECVSSCRSRWSAYHYNTRSSTYMHLKT